jgi:uncharacterized protein
VLEMRPCCEHCGRDLPPGDLEARICTFECTFCATCAAEELGDVCPNCAGELVARPVRPAELLGTAPASTERLHAPVDLAAHRARRAERPVDGDHPGVVLRRYAQAWLTGDLDGILSAYGDEFALHYFGRSEFAGDHVGREAALATLAAVSARAPRRLDHVDDLLVSIDGGALVVTETLARDGESVTLRRVLRYRVRDGKFQECWLYDERQDVVDHFWRPEGD